MPTGGGRPDPEVQAGRALRRLRLSRNWSQEEVARRMKAFGYDFHQTMIAKIEAAQRPLRVRELADFAALYGVEVQELIYPPNGSPSDIEEAIFENQARRAMVEAETGQARQRMEAARQTMHEAQAVYDRYSAERAVLEERLAFLMAEREQLARWTPDENASATEDRASS